MTLVTLAVPRLAIKSGPEVITATAQTGFARLDLGVPGWLLFDCVVRTLSAVGGKLLSRKST